MIIKQQGVVDKLLSRKFLYQVDVVINEKCSGIFFMFFWLQAFMPHGRRTKNLVVQFRISLF